MNDTLNTIKKYGDLPPMPLSQFKALAGAAKTAVHRKDASVPVRHFLGTNVARPLLRSGATRWFDYGSGHGADVRYLRGRGIDAVGWDPYWSEIYPAHPQDSDEQKLHKMRKAEISPSDVVSMTYVLNVIASENQRLLAIHDASTYVVPGGLMMIATRTHSDVDAAARRGGWVRSDGGGYWVNPREYRHQRGFTHTELQAEVNRAVLRGAWEDLGPVPGTGFTGRVWRRKP